MNERTRKRIQVLQRLADSSPEDLKKMAIRCFATLSSAGWTQEERDTVACIMGLGVGEAMTWSGTVPDGLLQEIDPKKMN